MSQEHIAHHAHEQPHKEAGTAVTCRKIPQHSPSDLSAQVAQVATAQVANRSSGWCVVGVAPLPGALAAPQLCLAPG